MRFLPLTFALSLVAALFTLFAPFASAETASPSLDASKENTNAADLYRQASKITRELTPQDKAIIADARMHQAEAAALLEGFSEPLALYAEASRLPQCDWELDYSAGPSTELPHLSSLISLSRLTLLKLRLHVIDGKFPEALEDARQVFATSRRAISKQPLVIEMLVAVSIENMAIQSLADGLSHWDSTALQSLSNLLSRQSPLPLLADIVQSESQSTLHWLRRTLDHTRQNPSPASNHPTLPEFLRGDAATVDAMLASLDADSQHCVKLLRLPLPEAIPAITAYKKRLEEAEATAPLSFSTLCNMTTVLHPVALLEIHRNMLLTAIAIREGASAAVEKSRDPVTGKPFGYEKTETGFTLSSEHLNLKGETTTLSIR